MFDLRPTSVDLLKAAAKTVAEWDPNETSALAHAEVLLAGRAVAIALREISFARGAAQATARDIIEIYGNTSDESPDLVPAPGSLCKRLAEDIRAGRFDDGTGAHAVHSLLTTAARRWLEIVNPSYAEKRSNASIQNGAPR